MKSNRDAELKKYLEKKKKQKTRDEIMAKIVELSNNRKQNTLLPTVKLKKKAKNKESFEDRLFDNTEYIRSSETESEDDSGHDEHANKNKTVFPENNESLENIDFDQNDSQTNINTVEAFEENSKTSKLDLSENDRNTAMSEENKNKIHEIKEIFEVNRCQNRLQEIQNQRMKLDIFYEEAEIVSQIKYNIITFIQGETGCGKTTQIPQFLYENGFSKDGMICVTQPRRFSAVSISDRINKEANQRISGYKIKYENNITPDTRVKVVTEGVLFREIQSDFLLKEYSVIILDEVHERSANMDILIGLLTRIARIRLDQKNILRIVLMSATVDPDHFRPVLGDFQLIRLNSRMFSVSVFFENKTEEDYITCAFNKIKAILESEKKYKNNKKTADNIPQEINNDYKASILVFLASKDDIYSLKSRLELLEKQLVVLPLHSGLSKSQQSKVYETYLFRKIVLATNIAETSITINDIVFVIDCGREKKKIMDQNSVLYKIGYISKSSARQRMGRTGRTGSGVCYRMYDGDTFECFRDHNHPQILLEPFDSFMLQLKNMGIKNVFGFPFIDKPSNEMINESIQQLQSVGGLDRNGNITRLGREMCLYPIRSRYSRLLLLNKDIERTVFRKLVVIVSILSTNFEIKKTEDTNVYFVGAKSDLIAYLRIFIEFEKSKTKKAFLFGLPIEKFEEIRKLTHYLLKISGVDVDGRLFENDSCDEDEICRYLYYAFADQLAVSMGNSYLFKDGDVFISKDSVDVSGQNIVFDYLVCGSNKCYAKNITCVSLDWFK